MLSPVFDSRFVSRSQLFLRLAAFHIARLWVRNRENDPAMLPLWGRPIEAIFLPSFPANFLRDKFPPTPFEASPLPFPITP